MVSHPFRRLAESILPSRLQNIIRRQRGLFYEQQDLKRRLDDLERSMGASSAPEITKYLIQSHWRILDKLYEISGRVSPTECALCGFAGNPSVFKQYTSECIFLGGKLIRHQCPHCDVVFGPSKVLDLEDLMIEMDYRLHYSIFCEGDSTEKIIRAFNLLSPSRDGLYLDYGCGVARPKALEILRNEGYSIMGYEPTLKSSSEYVLTTKEEILRHRFNGILTHNVLEHLFDPIQTTRTLKELLTPGGLLVHATPCFEYLYEYTRFHVFFFLGKSLDYLACESGMAIKGLIKDNEHDFMAVVLARTGID